MLTDAVVVARGGVHHNGLEGGRVADVDQLNPAFDVVQVQLLGLEGAAVGLEYVGVAGVGIDQLRHLLFGAEIVQHRHGGDGFADAAFAATDEDDGCVHRIAFQGRSGSVRRSHSMTR
jgi:hypothetical protein